MSDDIIFDGTNEKQCRLLLSTELFQRSKSLKGARIGVQTDLLSYLDLAEHQKSCTRS